MSNDLLTHSPNLTSNRSTPRVVETFSHPMDGQRPELWPELSAQPRTVTGLIAGLPRSPLMDRGTADVTPAGRRPDASFGSSDGTPSKSLARQRAIELCASGPVRTPVDASQRVRSLSSTVRTISECNELVDGLESLTETDDPNADVIDQETYLQLADSILRFANKLRAKTSIEQDLSAGGDVEEATRTATTKYPLTHPDDVSELLEYAAALARNGGTYASEQTLYETQLSIERAIHDRIGVQTQRAASRKPELNDASEATELHQHSTEDASAERPRILRRTFDSYVHARRAGSSIAVAVRMTLPLPRRLNR